MLEFVNDIILSSDICYLFGLLGIALFVRLCARDAKYLCNVEICCFNGVEMLILGISFINFVNDIAEQSRILLLSKITCLNEKFAIVCAFSKDNCFVIAFCDEITYSYST